MIKHIAMEEMFLKYFNRVLCEGKGNSSEIEILPLILTQYQKLFNVEAIQGNVPYIRNNPFNSGTNDTNVTDFPTDGYVTASQIAPFLGYTKGKYKRPEAAVHRLASEGKIPKPTYIGSRSPRWRAGDIWDYVSSQKGGTKDAA
jgi:predicted DNA-binding transcriptional regulator AlpA